MSVKIAVTKVKCFSDTDEWNSDEPYVLVTGVNLKALVPTVEVTRYGPWNDVDDGDTRTTFPISPDLPFDPDPMGLVGTFRKPCWGLDGKAAPINNPDDVALLVSLMENDDGDVSAMRTLVKSAAVVSLAASTSSDRATRVKKLQADIDGALQIPTGAPNFDDPIGATQEFRLTKDLLDVNGHKKTKSLTFKSDGGRYEVSLEITKG
jgi:hypothetical protein